MTSAPERIPIPPQQRAEIFRERVFPPLCFVLTLVACAWLWRYQSHVSPFALGEVHVETATVKTPHAGKLERVEGFADGQWPLYAEVDKSTVVARVKRSKKAAPATGSTAAGAASGTASGTDAAAEATAAVEDVVTIESPMKGAITEIHAHPGEALKKGEKILTISASEGSYVLCHLPSYSQMEAKPGLEVAIRPQVHGASWTRTVIQAVGPSIEATPTFEGVDIAKPGRGVPLRIAIPMGLSLKPGALVEVRFGKGPAGE